MLVLARKSQESVVIGVVGNLHEVVRVTVLEVHKGIVKLGFEANDDVTIYRKEVWDRVFAERQTLDPKQEAQPTVSRVP